MMYGVLSKDISGNLMALIGFDELVNDGEHSCAMLM